MKTFANLAAASAALLILAACTQAPPSAADTREADAKAIRAAEAQANEQLAQKDKDLDKIAMFWADDASLMVPNIANLKGNAAIKGFLKEMVSDPNFSLKFAADTVEVAKSGDLAYTQGTYTMTMTDPKTKKAVTEKGKYTTVFKKQADGSWRAAADINNADAPAAPQGN
jgi:uncharacterized protein (TIGR02246 family)